jgi:hypothetical protein
LLIGVIVAVGLGLVVVGIVGIVKRETGTRAKATITECHFVSGGGRTGSEECDGTWVVGGSLLGNGHVAVGEVDGAESSDIGKTITVVVSGDHAYTPSLVIPIVLLCLGLLIVAVGAMFRWIMSPDDPADAMPSRPPAVAPPGAR